MKSIWIALCNFVNPPPPPLPEYRTELQEQLDAAKLKLLEIKATKEYNMALETALEQKVRRLLAECDRQDQLSEMERVSQAAVQGMRLKQGV